MRNLPALFSVPILFLLFECSTAPISLPQKWINEKFQDKVLEPHGALIVYLPPGIFEGKRSDTMQLELRLTDIREGRLSEESDRISVSLPFIPKEENILYFPIPVGTYRLYFEMGYDISTAFSEKLEARSDDSLQGKFDITVTKESRFVIRPEAERTEGDLALNLSLFLFSPILFPAGKFPYYKRTHSFGLEVLPNATKETREEFFLPLGEVYEANGNSLKLKSRPGTLSPGQVISILDKDDRTIAQAKIIMNFHAYSEAKIIEPYKSVKLQGLRYGVIIKK